MALLYRWCHGDSPRARQLLAVRNMHRAKSSNYTTQENYQTLQAQSVRHDTLKHLTLFPLTSVYVVNFDTCFATDRYIRPLQYNKNVKVKVH
jgi:hypothetical protein